MRPSADLICFTSVDFRTREVLESSQCTLHIEHRELVDSHDIRQQIDAVAAEQVEAQKSVDAEAARLAVARDAEKASVEQARANEREIAEAARRKSQDAGEGTRTAERGAPEVIEETLRDRAV